MRYLLPLNNDEPFKAVFANTEIAKSFLEDFLGVSITEIELLPTYHKVTHAASVVRFDFRCKIEGQYVLIEMQKVTYNYLIKRFYLYHCLSMALQLEFIQDKIEKMPDGSEKTTKRYEQLFPVITLNWIALEDWGFSDDFLDFRMYPHFLWEFLTENRFWRGDKEALLEMRQNLLEKGKRVEKNFGFHTENRLIYVFQKNVVKNASNQPYVRWFEFAQKTLNPNNTEIDFKPYINDLIFSKMIQRLTTQSMPPAELRAMLGEEAYAAALQATKESEEVERRFQIKKAYYDMYGEEVYEREAAAERKLTMAHQEFWKIEKVLLKEAKEKEAARLQAEQEKAQVEQEKIKAEQEKIKAEQEKVKAEKLVAEQKELLQKEKEAKKLLLKAERDKAKAQQKVLLKAEKEKQEQLLKVEKKKQEQLLKAEKEKQEQLLKAEKEKQEQLLKAEKEKQERLLAEKEKQEQLLKAEKEKQERLLVEKEKQEQLLKAEKEKNQLKMLELGRKMLESGQDINFICNLLSISEAALRG